MTKLLKPTDAAIKEAASLIRSGEVAAFPTETVYGLGADARNPEAIRRIFRAKGRPQDNPLIVHISAIEQLSDVIAGELPQQARILADHFWPGPLTMILPKGEMICSECTAGLDSVGVRFPSNECAQRLIAASGVPIAAPSANLSGKPSPTTAQHVYNDMDGKIPMILDGGACAVGLESTVVDVRSTPVRVLRPGGITPEMIADALGEVEVDGSVLRPLKQGEVARSPGMKYKHYAPNGSLLIVEGEAGKVAAKINELYDAAEGSRCIFALEKNLTLYGNRTVYSLGQDASQAAQNLFRALRDMDAQGVNSIFSEAVATEGIGLAVMNRLGRAAAFNIIKV